VTLTLTQIRIEAAAVTADLNKEKNQMADVAPADAQQVAALSKRLSLTRG